MIQVYVVEKGKPTWNVWINFVNYHVNIKGGYKLDKNIPSRYKNLAKNCVASKLSALYDRRSQKILII